MRIKTSELSGPSLDWAVAQCEHLATDETYTPSTRWDQGGPIIEREGITTRKVRGTWHAMSEKDSGTDQRVNWCRHTYIGAKRYGKLSYEVSPRTQRFEGDSLLVAAMRCHVATRLGDEVEVPSAYSETSS